ncbi:MAG: hypothetical protein IT374_00710 [Polyangiaceae bacterium]|nr:hypothetical protein [Polyangiaceae bacterium]
MKSVAAASISLLVACGGARAPTPSPRPLAPAPAAPSPPAPSASADLDPSWERVTLVSLPESKLPLPAEASPSAHEVLWEDDGCGPQAIAGSGEAMFVLCSRQGEVLRVGADKQARVLYRNEAPLAFQALGGDQVFVAQAGAGVVLSFPQAGGPFRVLTRGVDGPHGLGADGQAAYVVSPQRLVRVTRAGDERVLAHTTATVTSLVARAGEVVFVDALPATAIAPSRSVVLRVQGAGAPTLVAAFAELIDRLAGDDQALYAHLAQRDELVRLPRAGAPTILTRTRGVASGPLSDGRHVYWLETAGGAPAVLRAKATGGPAEIALQLSPNDAPQQLALTDAHVLVLLVTPSARVVRAPK